MDLLKYLEPMKNLPKRFSNLAFWRDVRKFKDEVVNALEYVDGWGKHIESSLPSGNYVESSSISVTNYNNAPKVYIHTLETNTSDGTTTILPIMYGKFELVLENSVLIGKTFDNIVARFVDGNGVSRYFVLPNGDFSSVYKDGKYRDGYVVEMFSCLSRLTIVTTTDLPNVRNQTLAEIVVYYH